MRNALGKAYGLFKLIILLFLKYKIQPMTNLICLKLKTF